MDVLYGILGTINEVTLKTSLGYLSKTQRAGFYPQPIVILFLKKFVDPHDVDELLLCPVRALQEFTIKEQQSNKSKSSLFAMLRQSPHQGDTHYHC